jgi:hypothetical protein
MEVSWTSQEESGSFRGSCIFPRGGSGKLTAGPSTGTAKPIAFLVVFLFYFHFFSNAGINPRTLTHARQVLPLSYIPRPLSSCSLPI